MKKEVVLKGVSWQFSSQIACQLFSVGVTAILARLLTPEDYGLVALSTVFVGFGWLFGNLGMGAAIVQKAEVDEDLLSTAFWTSVFSGAVITLILIWVSFFIKSYYNNQTLQLIVIVSSISFIIGPLTTIHSEILTRSLEFKKLSFVQIINTFISLSVSVLLAFLGCGVWSLVLGALFSNIVNIPIMWSIVPWRPKFIFLKKSFQDLFGFGSKILAFNIINYFGRNLDNLLIGKMLGPLSLGYYSIAYQLMMKPLQHISSVVGRVLFPAFSSIQHDKERVGRVYVKVTRTISLVTFPMMFGLMSVAPEFILIYYGAQWEQAILPTQLLCIVGALQSIGTNAGSIFTSQGRADLQLKLGMLNTSITVTAFFIGLQWGLIGLIVGYMVSTLITFLPSQYYATRLIHLELKSYLLSVIPALTCSVLMVITLFIFRNINNIFFQLNIYLTLIVVIFLGIFSYLSTLKIFFGKFDEIDDIKQLFSKKLSRLFSK